MRAGRGELLAELRPAYPLFLRFAGIDFDRDPDAYRGARRVRALSRSKSVSAYGGNLLQLTLGDKGAYLYGVSALPYRPRGRRDPRGGGGARAARSRANDASP